ncbi:AhpA/YtjB family protein, partial [Salmonella enterica subsp. enterica serovar Montevideo]|nr:AhpA/YtjB family protein [Salmonella enterica subsp. enterica serovar Montevideo]
GISEGCHCLGYHMWTFIDNWSWLNGYKNRYGFVQLDLATQTRAVKKSKKAGSYFNQQIVEPIQGKNGPLGYLRLTLDTHTLATEAKQV